MTKPKAKAKAKAKAKEWRPPSMQKMKRESLLRALSDLPYLFQRLSIECAPEQRALVLHLQFAVREILLLYQGERLADNQHRALKLQKKIALATAKTIERKNPRLKARSLADRVQKRLEIEMGEDAASFSAVRRWLDDRK